MTKAELIERISKKTNQSKALTARMINATFEELAGVMKKGDSIAMTGFGTFSVIKRKARKGVNPRTGATMTIPASKAPRFKPGKHLKEVVR